MAWILPAAMMGASVAKYLTDSDSASRQRKVAAETAKYSPWTGMTPQVPGDPSLLGDLMAGGASAASLYQGAQTADAQKAMNEKTGTLMDSYGKNLDLQNQKLAASIPTAASQVTPAPVGMTQMPQAPEYSLGVQGPDQNAYMELMKKIGMSGR